MPSFAILSASNFEKKQTDTQTNGGENPTPTTAVGVHGK